MPGIRCSAVVARSCQVGPTSLIFGSRLWQPMQALVPVNCLPRSGSAVCIAARIFAGKPTHAGSIAAVVSLVAGALMLFSLATVGVAGVNPVVVVTGTVAATVALTVGDGVEVGSSTGVSVAILVAVSVGITTGVTVGMPMLFSVLL